MTKPAILCLLATEAAERFAFNGFRALLVLYLVQELDYSESTAVAVYSYSNSLAYFTPILGACLADGPWGRYPVIARFGTLYLLGLIVLTAAAAMAATSTEALLGWKRTGSFAGLFLVCLATGGIKPVVSSFGADQVATGRTEDVRAFFSYFYFCINVGALTSSATVPIVQATLGFATAFGVAAGFMALALALFVSQRRSYRYVSTEGTIIDAFKTAVLLLCGGNGSDDAYYQTLPAEITGNEDEMAAVQRKEALRRDVSQTMQILPIFAMLPIYWSLYDQQGSVWTLQATRMDLPFGMQPAQLNLVNPLQILLFIPVFDRTIYPFFERKGINVSPLNRMSWGMTLMALAFLVSGMVESTIQGREAAGGPKLSVFYQLPQITILSIGEIFLSITGLEYAYASSPVRLQSFVTAMYLATCGVGNALSGVLFSTVFVNMNRATIMFFCAAFMVVNQRIFERVAACATITTTTSRHERHERTGADVVEIELGNGVASIVDDRY